MKVRDSFLSGKPGGYLSFNVPRRWEGQAEYIVSAVFDCTATVRSMCCTLRGKELRASNQDGVVSPRKSCSTMAA